MTARSSSGYHILPLSPHFMSLSAVHLGIKEYFCLCNYASFCLCFRDDMPTIRVKLFVESTITSKLC